MKCTGRASGFAGQGLFAALAKPRKSRERDAGSWPVGDDPSRMRIWHSLASFAVAIDYSVSSQSNATTYPFGPSSLIAYSSAAFHAFKSDGFPSLS